MYLNHVSKDYVKYYLLYGLYIFDVLGSCYHAIGYLFFDVKKLIQAALIICIILSSSKLSILVFYYTLKYFLNIIKIRLKLNLNTAL